MNAKKAKALRRLVRRAGLQVEPLYLINTHTRSIRVGRCERGLQQHVKRRVKAGLIRLPLHAPGMQRPPLDAQQEMAHAA